MTKNGVIALIVAFSLVLVAFAGGVKLGRTQGADEVMSHVYPRCGTVIEVNYDEDVVVVADEADQVWVFEGCEDWMEGDLAAMIMDDNGTPDSIYDDVILDVLYGGASEG